MPIDINTDGIYTTGKIERDGYIDMRKTFGGTMRILEKGNQMLIVEPVGKGKVRIFYKFEIMS